MSDDTDTQESQNDSADAAGVEAEGFDSHNNSREETQAIMEADSPDDIDEGLLKEIEEERKERLDPDNRPPNAEVDNTQRTFIAEEARFEDTDLSEEEKDDGVGQKEPDPETQAGSSDDVKDEATSPDTDAEGEATAQEADSDASTGPQAGDQTSDQTSDQPRDENSDGSAQEPGRHKA